MTGDRSKGGRISGLVKAFPLGFAFLVVAALFIRNSDNAAPPLFRRVRR